MNRLPPRHLPTAVGRARDSLRMGDPDPRTDADLLERFGRYGDHPAFEAVVRRHGPMVLGVCRRVLGNSADVDDAFQATFLVLIRRVRAVRGERLSPWLYGVAFRVSLKARGRAARAAARQTEVTDMIPDPASPVDPPDWLPIFDAELNALPAKYREPMVLCELQGTARADAARALGIPEGTLSSRLARGRLLLRKRLLRLGTLLPTSGLVALLGAGGLGRAMVPAGLLARTAELALPEAGGAAPAGPARLTDEVVKEMLLAKLRLAAGAVLIAGLMAVGWVAAWPGEAPGQPGTPKSAAKAAAASPGPTKPDQPGPARPDQEAVQGLWVLDKIEFDKKGITPQVQAHATKLVGKLRYLVTGDVWWGMGVPDGNIVPHAAKLDPTKNPKWLDLTAPAGANGTFPGPAIYQLDGDRLLVCVSGGGPESGPDQRPAEFVTDDSPLVLLQFRREPAAPPAGGDRLVGSWGAREPAGFGLADGNPVLSSGYRVESYYGFLFALLPKDVHPDWGWVGGRYTVDAAKNPKWIDVDLVGGYPKENVTRIYGSYDTEGGNLKLALGLSGKRAFRPLDLKPGPDDQSDVLLLDLKPATTPLSEQIRQSIPPRPAPAKPTPGPAPTGTKPVPAPPVPAPAPTPQIGPSHEPPVSPMSSSLLGESPGTPLDRVPARARELIKVGKFAEAEAHLRAHLRSAPDGAGVGVTKLFLGVCLLQQDDSKATPPAANPTKNREEALQLFQQVVAEVDVRRQGGRVAENDSWLRTQAALRVIQTYSLMGNRESARAEGNKLRGEVVGTADELIVLSLMYHAYKQLDKSEAALDVHRQMREVFEKLKAKPGAFPGKVGEYSRKYWEDVWFAPDPPPGR